MSLSLNHEKQVAFPPLQSPAPKIIHPPQALVIFSDKFQLLSAVPGEDVVVRQRHWNILVRDPNRQDRVESHKVWEDDEIRPSLSVSFGDAPPPGGVHVPASRTASKYPACHGLEEIHPDVHALRLELAPFGVRLDRTLDAVRARGHLRYLSVQLSDVSCHNLLFDDHRVKLCDFGSSLIQGQAFGATDYEEAVYELPLRGRTLEGRPVTKWVLSALGPLIYEIMAWVKPFEGGGITEIEKLAQEVFHSMEVVVASEGIGRCWHEKGETGAEVMAALQKLRGRGGGGCSASPVSGQRT
ncbi:hypothetical protein DL765_001994 [Monosporascus sp. GIB2]|nr:hypothetical protein DL765_001994 [Monosporascus sp. GIB2]